MIPIAKPYLGEEEASAARVAILSGWVSQGPKVKEFEENFARLVGAPHACAVSNCTVALHLALLAIGVEPGDFVITVSHSFIATANSIRYCRAEPIFVDIDSTTYNISFPALKKLLESECQWKDKRLIYQKKGRVSALLVVHQMGMPCDLPSILPLAQRYHIPVVEDAACAVGSEITFDQGRRWEKIGRPHGAIACFSFHPRKIITTGEGGMITTVHSDYNRRLRLLRHQGMSISDLERHGAKRIVTETYDALGYNYRMTDIQAAIGIEQLKRLPDIIRKRRQLAEIYQEKLSAIPWLDVPREPSYCRTTWQSFPVRILASSPVPPKQFMAHLLKKGIATRPGIMNAHAEKIYGDLKWHLPNSEDARAQVVLLPLYYDMTIDECRFCIKQIEDIYEQVKQD